MNTGGWCLRPTYYLTVSMMSPTVVTTIAATNLVRSAEQYESTHSNLSDPAEGKQKYQEDHPSCS